MRKQSLVLATAIVVMLGVMLVVSMALVSCANDTTSELTLSGTYVCLASHMSDWYITFFRDGTCQMYRPVYGTREYDYTVSGSTLTIIGRYEWPDEWTIVDANTIRDGNDYIWKK